VADASEKKSGVNQQRSRSRRLAIQALYQWILNTSSANDLIAQFEQDNAMHEQGREYFRDIVSQSIAMKDDLDALIADQADRDIALLDPVEYAILLIGVYELKARIDVPYRVVINEAVRLSKKFGAQDGHKYVNAVLDGLSVVLRKAERDQAGKEHA
jgi:N utilization substance protein B